VGGIIKPVEQPLRRLLQDVVYLAHVWRGTLARAPVCRAIENDRRCIHGFVVTALGSIGNARRKRFRQIQ
jgi:hypothetical protein